jgi:hypothetical protein
VGLGAPRDEIEQRSDIRFVKAPLPPVTGGAIYGRRGDRAAIVVDVELDGPEEEAAIAHEFVHHLRGGPCADSTGMPATWSAVVAREEERVRGDVARWLIPRRDLVRFIEERMHSGEIGVTVAEVAEHFHRPAYVAERALRDLARENPDGWASVA